MGLRLDSFRVPGLSGHWGFKGLEVPIPPEVRHTGPFSFEAPHFSDASLIAHDPDSEGSRPRAQDRFTTY